MIHNTSHKNFFNLLIVILVFLSSLNLKATAIKSDLTIEPRIRFWVDIFSKYTASQYIIHDKRYPFVVFKVLDFSQTLKSNLSHFKKHHRIDLSIARTKSQYKTLASSALDSFCESKAVRSQKEEKILRLYSYYLSNSRLKDYCSQTVRVHSQQGMKETFISAIKKSGKYMAKMELIFKRYNVPTEITRLAFVESMFNSKAKSKVGASGLWQFMPETGKRYLVVNEWFDERNSPIKATFAAAKLLKYNYQQLKSWPLAITAYNHGLYGLKRAVAKLSSRHTATVLETYRGPSFGFASRNFYSEFIAAARVYARAPYYFGKISSHLPLRFKLVAIDHPITLYKLLKLSKINEKEFKKLNPDIKYFTYRSDIPLPKNYILLIPNSDFIKFKRSYGKYAALNP